MSETIKANESPPKSRSSSLNSGTDEDIPNNASLDGISIDTENEAVSRDSSLLNLEVRAFDTDRRDFRLFFVAVNIVASVELSILIYILCKWLDGFRWHPDEANSSDFSVHLVCTVLGCVIMTAYGILIFRAFPNYSHQKIIVIHSVVMVLAVFIATFGIKIAYESHHIYGGSHLYSFHSWMGVTILGLLYFELVTGNWLFFTEVVHESLNFWHKIAGGMIFLISLGATVSGVLTAGLRAVNVDSNMKATRQYTLNVFGVLAAVFGVLVRHLYTEYRFRRRPRPSMTTSTATKDASKIIVVMISK